MKACLKEYVVQSEVNICLLTYINKCEVSAIMRHERNTFREKAARVNITKLL